MSIRVMTAVWDHAPVSGGALVVLLAMADYAHDDGGGVYPTQGTLAEKARMTDRQLRRVLSELEENGYIERVKKRGHTIEWRVESDPDILSGRTPVSGSTGHQCPTEPSEEPPGSKTPSSPDDEQDRENGNTEVPAAAWAERYDDPKSAGEKTAPWLMIELAKLMRSNDPAAKLPVGLRGIVQLPPDSIAELLVSREAAVAAFASRGWHSSLKGWLDAGRLLIDADDRPPNEVVKVLRWSQEDDFWRAQIKSITNLRKHYEKMREKALREYGVQAAPADRTTTQQLDALAGRARGDCDECGAAYGQEHLPHCARREAA